MLKIICIYLKYTQIKNSEIWKTTELGRQFKCIANSMAAVLSQAVSEFISNYRNNNRKGALAKLELAKHHLKSLGWMLVEDKLKYKYYVSPDGKRFPSLIGACEASLALNRTTDPQENAADNLDLNSIIHRNACYKSNMDLVPRESETNYSLRTSVSTSWEPVQLGAEYSPEIVSLLSKHQEGRSTLLQRRVTNQTLKIKLRKHLLALGWGIKSKIDRSTRFRYDSPNGKSYYSFPQVFHSLMDGSIKGSRGYRIEGKPEQHNYLEWNTAEIHAKQSRDILILGKLKPEYQSDAIADYLHYTGAAMQNFRISQQKELGEQVRLSAKGHLKSSGWKFQSKQRSDDRQEMRYRAPHGRSYNSLLAACKEHLEVYQNSDNASPEITTNDCTDGSMHSFKLIGLNSGLRDSSGRQKSQNQLVSIAERFDNMLILPTHSSGHGKSKKRKVSPVQLSQAHILRSRARNGQILSCQHRAKTILSLLMDKNILLPRDKLTYKQRSDGPRMKEGLITGDGIKCMCCNEVFTLANFESHAGSSTQRPSAHMFLKDGRSLSQCLVQLMGENKPKGSLHVRLKGKYSDLENDSICSICHDGGEILLCDHCPSSFHHACVGLEVTPEGSWYCPSCRCNICDSSDYDPDSNKFTDKTIMYCDQCEREYHVGCIRNKGHHLSCHPQRGWLCSRECSKIFQHLQKLIGKSFPTPVEGLSCTILRFSRENASSCGDCDDETMAEQHAKLCVALDVLHECFVTIIEPRTQSDLSEDIVFNRESELRRLNFRGCYTILLEKGDELISVGTFRVFGKKIAELPLIGTRVPYRRQGMCRLLMNELEKLLSGLGVERLLLPAVPQLLETWTGSFGFTIMSYSDRLELAENIILSFQGTTMCQKVINNAGNVPEELRGFDDQPESTSMHREREDNDGQESTSEVVENRKQLEPMLLLEKQSNSSEEGICPIDTINSPSSSCIPDLVSSAEDKREQPQVSVHADQCKDNCVLTEVKPVAPQAIPTLKYKTSGKCYQRISKSAGGRNAWLKISIR